MASRPLILTALLITALLPGCASSGIAMRSRSFSWEPVAGATFYRLNRNGEDLPPVQTTHGNAPVARGDVFFVRAFNDITNSPASNEVRF